jgi:hypothetical protein
MMMKSAPATILDGGVDSEDSGDDAMVVTAKAPLPSPALQRRSSCCRLGHYASVSDFVDDDFDG